jgi:hypothetical protein
MKRPKRVGYWVLAAYFDGDLIKWGHDGGTERPYRTLKEARLQAAYLASDGGDRRLWIAHVFENGRMRTEEFETDFLVKEHALHESASNRP